MAKQTLSTIHSSSKGSMQLGRLRTLSDVIYALVIWRAFEIIPRPGVDGEWASVGAYFAENWPVGVLIAISLIFTIIYWSQSNTLLGAIERTDTKHSALSVLQLFFLLIFLYAIRVGVELEASPWNRTFESVAAALVGYSGALAWLYASKGRRLLPADVTDEDAREFGTRILAEPLTATVTIPMAWVGAWTWELSWLLYPVIVLLVRRKRRH